MKTELVRTLTCTFEAHAQQTDTGVEYWLARDIQHLLGYAEWRNFSAVVAKAQIACERSGHTIADHFVEVNKTIQMPKGASKSVPDLLLTRYACYLIAQNGDPKKQTIAFAQTYFAVQTRRAELIELRLSEAERVTARRKLSKTEKALSGVIFEQTGGHDNFARIRSETTIADEHVRNNQAVRRTLRSRGIHPETLPSAEDVKRVERRLATEAKQVLRKPAKLGGADDT